MLKPRPFLKLGALFPARHPAPEAFCRRVRDVPRPPIPARSSGAGSKEELESVVTLMVLLPEWSV